MPPANIRTIVDQLHKLHTANQTDTSFPSRIITATEPVTGTGIVDVLLQGTNEANANVLLVPFGTDAADETFNMRVIGWKLADFGSGSTNDLWVPLPLVTCAVTLGAGTGVGSNASLPSTEFIADTITITTGLGARDLYSPADDTLAWISVDMMGARKLEVTFDRVAAASCNVLWAIL